jgi:hypothetical protein
MAEGNEEEEDEEAAAAMVCDERGRKAMSRRQDLWRNQHGKVAVEVVQSKATVTWTRVACCYR